MYPAGELAVLRQLLFFLPLLLSRQIQQMTNQWYFSYFSQKKEFAISWKLSQIVSSLHETPKYVHKIQVNGLEE